MAIFFPACIKKNERRLGIVRESAILRLNFLRKSRIDLSKGYPPIEQV